MNVPLVPPDTETSPVSKPVTSSEKVKVAVKAVVEAILAGTSEIVTVGAVASQVAVADTVLAGPLLPRPSITEFAAILITTSSDPFGLNDKEALEMKPGPMIGNPLRVAPVQVTFCKKPKAKLEPSTFSEKFNVKLRTLRELILSGTPVIVTDGPMTSQTAVAETSAAGPDSVPSVAALAATVTTKFADPSGVTTSV